MNVEARNQYMETLREHYLRASKKEKGRILDEYCRNTGQERKYSIKKFRYKIRLKKAGEQRKPRKEAYDGPVKVALVRMWEIFDTPCGQRLKPLLRDETERMRHLGELACSNEVAKKLQRIAASTIDEKLKHEKEVLLLHQKYKRKNTPLLCHQVPMKASYELDREHPGQIQVDCVEHCGASASGEYVNSLSTVDIFSGWWEGDAVMGKGQERALAALDIARKRAPFSWNEIHPDNGGNIMNYHLYAYATKEELAFSRSRPYQKNDNCFVEQKNSTHVRQIVGYLRYDTEEERRIISDLYCNELRLYKNFFQPVMKLVSKTRVHGKIHKKYDAPQTPYRRLMESNSLSKTQKNKLRKLYQTLNPAELKRTIDTKLQTLYQTYQKKNGSSRVETNRPYRTFGIISKKLVPATVSFYIGQPT